MRKFIAKLIVFFVIMLGLASAEISTNLKTETTLNARNKIVTLAYVDENGNRVMADDLGYASLLNTYTTGTKLAKTEYFDVAGNPINIKAGYQSHEFVYTMNNVKSEEYRDKDGNLVLGPDGYARLEGDYISGKKHLEDRFYGTDGQLLRSTTQPARYVITYIEGSRRVTSETWYDADGNYMTGPKGYARVENEYIGKVTTPSKVTYLNAEGKLYYNPKEKYAQIEREIVSGRVLSETTYGADGKMCAGPKGYARIEMAYKNNSSKPTTERYFDTEGNPYRMPDGYCGLTRKYGLKGRVEEEKYFDGAGAPTLSKKGYHMVKTGYTGGGKILKETYYGTDGQRILLPELGYASLENTYYNGKYLTSTTYYDANGKITDTTEGFAKIVYTFKNKVAPH